MKKLLILLPVVFAFSACGNGIDERFRDGPVQTEMSGILVEQKTTDKEPGTHFLQTDDGEKVALRSLTLQLSKPDYLSNRVKVVGLNDKENIFSVTGISVLEILAPAEILNGEMTIYQNQNLGFKIAYRNDWELVGDNDGVIFYSKNSGSGADVDRVMISRHRVTYDREELTPEEEIDPLLAYYNHETYGASKLERPGTYESMKNQIGVDKINALKVGGGLNVGYYIARTHDYFYYISYVTATKESQPDNLNVFQTMLGEFRLIPISEENGEMEVGDSPVGETVDVDEPETSASSDKLTTFESKVYSFRAAYPSDWYYAGKRVSQDDTIHHYGFSNEEVTGENEILSLDIISGDIPRGFKFKADGREFVEIRNSGKYTIYTAVDGQNYKLSGDAEYKDLLLKMAGSIVSIEN
ncbi:hypothetical protein HYW82_03540 [Candidatus Peregrinibacteria bacterium]|nr:hypothetical protein [Candidatus Peregrinibacteria bacterium]